MEIKVLNKDKLFLIASIVGFIAFFLPWVGGGFVGQHSGYDLLTYGRELGGSEIWLLVLLPASFFVIILSKLSVIKEINPALLKIIEIIPISLIVISFSNLLESLGIRLEDLGEVGSDFFQIFKIGFPLTLIASITVVFSPLSK